MTWEIRQGDVLERLREMPAESVHCVVTSPPYWGLRTYGVDSLLWGGDPDCSHEWGPAIVENATNHTGKARWQHTRNGRDEEQPIEKRVAWLRTNITQGSFCQLCGAWYGDLGLEPTPELYVAHMVEVFREVRRVLHKSGTLWLNMGDSYSGSGRGMNGDGSAGQAGEKQQTNVGANLDFHDKLVEAGAIGRYWVKPPPGLKPKDLVGMPWRLAFALQADGWWLRSDIIWAKPNPMPESVTDRPTKAHEYIFLMTKAQTYFYDAEAIREPLSEVSIARISQPTFDDQQGGPKDYRNGINRHRSARQGLENLKGAHERGQGRNKRTVWEIATEPFPDAHFATFPTALVEPCIKAGSSEKGVCPVCLAPWRREIEVDKRDLKREAAHAFMNSPTKVDSTGWTSGNPRTIGWRPSCKHEAESIQATVLDPFAGSGTTGLVALRLGRSFVGIELNPAYVKMARKRITNDAPLLNTAAEVSE